MPLDRSQTGQKSIEEEGRLLLAIQAIKNKEITSIREVVRRFNMPRTTLRDRINSHQFRSETHANSHKLTQTEEESLKR